MHYRSVPPFTMQLLWCAWQERLLGLRDVSKNEKKKNVTLLDSLINSASESETGTPQLPKQAGHH